MAVASIKAALRGWSQAKVMRNWARAMTARRSRRPGRPTVEGLEARVVMAASVLDPTFGSGGYLPLDGGNFQAEAMQSDGKIVELAIGSSAANPLLSTVIVRRDNADGTVDTSFGTNGSTIIAIPGAPANDEVGAANLAIGPDGSITLAGNLFDTNYDPPAGFDAGFLVRLTAGGRFDPTFGNGGVVSVPNPTEEQPLVAVQPDGKILAASAPSYRSTAAPHVTRYNVDGTVDTSFGVAGTVTIPFAPVVPGSTDVLEALGALKLTSTGQILVGLSRHHDGGTFEGTGTLTSDSAVVRLNGDGGLDPTFGVGGLAELTSDQSGGIAALTLQDDGQIIVAGTRVNLPAGGPPYIYQGTLTRLTADGTLDTAFRPVLPTGPVTYGGGILLSQVAVGPDGIITVAGITTTAGFDTQTLIARYLPSGAADPNFGYEGVATIDSFATANGFPQIKGLVITPDNKIEVINTTLARVLTDVTTPAPDPTSSPVTSPITPPTQTPIGTGTGTTGPGTGIVTDNPVTPITPIGAPSPTPTTLPTGVPPKPDRPTNDYDGDGKSDVAAVLATLGEFAIRRSTGGDVVGGFGMAGAGAAITAPGDYDGDGKADIAEYLPSLGVLAYRPSHGGADVLVPFGMAGAGRSEPAPGDYDGDGRTDVAVFLPSLGILAYRPSAGGADVLVRFGMAGAGGSIPAPGDYDGDGRTDVAAYLPSLGVLAYRPSSGGADVLEPFGMAGLGASIPVPGDYDGDGRTDAAVYLPSLGLFAYRPSAGGADVMGSFGMAGAGNTIPAAGDFDGDGRTDMAAYLPGLGLYAYRPSTGGPDVVQSFGTAGTYGTIPAGSISYAQASSPLPAAAGSAPAGALVIASPLTAGAATPAATGVKISKSKHPVKVVAHHPTGTHRAVRVAQSTRTNGAGPSH